MVTRAGVSTPSLQTLFLQNNKQYVKYMSDCFHNICLSKELNKSTLNLYYMYIYIYHYCRLSISNIFSHQNIIEIQILNK